MDRIESDEVGCANGSTASDIRLQKAIDGIGKAIFARIAGRRRVENRFAIGRQWRACRHGLSVQPR